MQTDHPLIFWDSYGLDSRHKGIGRHAYELSQYFLQNSVKLYSQSDISLDGFLVVPAIKTSWQPLPKLRAVGKANRYSQYLSESSKVWIYHGLSNFNIPTGRLPRIRKVLTLHDLIPLISPASVSLAQRIQMKLLLKRAIESADRVICVSEWTRQVAMDFFPGYSDKFQMLSNGFPQVTSLKTNWSKTLRVLMVGRYEIYKGYDLVERLLKLVPSDVEFHIVGDGALSKYFNSRLKDGLRINFYSSLSDDQLDGLYRSSSVLLHPSYYEGFCLPAAEAISRGIPVVYRKGSAIEEVVGPCGLAMDRDARDEQWLEAILEVDSWRPRVELFEDWLGIKPSWQTISQQLYETYLSLI